MLFIADRYDVQAYGPNRNVARRSKGLGGLVITFPASGDSLRQIPALPTSSSENLAEAKDV
jgi:hypothetical protein